VPQASPILRDTTLREGAQIPGARAALTDQQRFVELLDGMGVQEIEIGLPSGVDACAGLGRFIRERGLGIRPTALVPCYAPHWRQQVDLAAASGIKIDVLVPVSDVLLRDFRHYRLTAEEILPRLAEVLSYAASRGVAAGAALMDSCRTPRPRLLELLRPLAGLGAERAVIYDSVGTMLPWQMSELIAEVRQATALPLLVHCHNDHGMATANTLAAFAAGAAAADVAVNGLGGRAGNAALEEVVLGLEALCGRPTGIDTRRLSEASALAERMTGVAISPLKPMVGRYVFSHVPVMHVRCIAGGNPQAFEPFAPERVGATRRYGFSLTVDYAPALESLLESFGDGATVDPADLLARLREQSDWDEEAIRACIHDLRHGKQPT
jgi:isopropylmalate/homocitrate/citramalate synthase